MKTLFLSIGIFLFFLFRIGYVHGQFNDVTEQYGVEQTQVNKAFLGGGVAFIDFNKDGWEDMVLTGGSEPDKLYLNLQGEVFQEITEPFTRFSSSDISSAVVSGDLNNDGCIDLVVTNYTRTGYDLLYANNCDGTFSLIDSTNALSSPTNSIGATLFDFNNDGLLDIYIIGHVEELVFVRDADNNVVGYDHICGKNRLYINVGNFEFIDQTDLYNAEGLGCSLATTVVPRPDTAGYAIFIANDFGPFLFPNEYLAIEDEKLKDFAPRYNLDKSIYGMGIGIGDIDTDGDLDLYITNLGENLLHVNTGDQFVEAQEQWGVQNTNAPDGRLTTGWGTFFTDTDNDKDIDLYVANGTIQSPEFIAGTFSDPNRFFLNDSENLLFTETDEDFGIAKLGANINRGAAKSDWDNDGDEDIINAYINFIATSREDLVYKLYENIANFPERHFIKIDLQPNRNAPGAFGALISVYIDGQKYIKYKYSGGSHASQNSQLIHFGLGSSTLIDSVEVTWRDQSISKFYDIAADQVIRLTDDTDEVIILGCTDQSSTNYNDKADVNWGCYYSSTTGTVVEETSLNRFEIFPNPNRNNMEPYVDLEFDTYQTRIQISTFNLLGQELYREEIMVNGYNYRSTLPLTNLPKGVFLVTVEDNTGLDSRKFLNQ